MASLKGRVEQLHITHRVVTVLIERGKTDRRQQRKAKVGERKGWDHGLAKQASTIMMQFPGSRGGVSVKMGCRGRHTRFIRLAKGVH
jgi:hypothetical protein